ncbi:MAG: DUF5004 domain-containing protein [Sphingobacteriaceae bacterium]
MKHHLFYRLLALFLPCCLFSSCEDKLSTVSLDESAKNVTGSWQVTQITRNGEDLSERMDFSGFSIDFNEDGSYTTSENLPFLVQGTGAYDLNDPQYPFSLVLTPSTSQEAVSIDFQFPIVDGKRQLNLTMSLGCSSNSYQYSLERINKNL